MVVIRKEGLSSVEEKLALMTSLAESKSHAKLEGVHAGKYGRVISRAANEEEATKLLRGVSGFEVRGPETVRPKVVVFDVPAEVASSEALLMEELGGGKNFPEMAAYDLKSKVRYVSRWKGVRNQREEDVLNVILSVSGDMLGRMVGKRVYLGYRSCPVKEEINTGRCFSCYGYGHNKENCPDKEVRLCRKCCREGHIAAACPERDFSCRNCKSKGLPDKHGIVSRDCPLARSREDRVRTRISYV